MVRAEAGGRLHDPDLAAMESLFWGRTCRLWGTFPFGQWRFERLAGVTRPVGPKTFHGANRGAAVAAEERGL
jgi:hypothetical protein